jgi:hypothetical protein
MTASESDDAAFSVQAGAIASWSISVMSAGCG